MPSLAKTARNAAIAEVALAFARDRLRPAAPAPKRRRGLKLLALGGAAVAGIALLKRDKVAALLPGGEPAAPPAPPAYEPPPVSNYDAPGPVSNTATSVPVPPPAEPAPGDEAAEEAAAAAEAANIGGPKPEYAGASDDEPASPAQAPLAEAGEGVSEGAEQAEEELRESADAAKWQTWSDRSGEQ
ncbi:MAG TPA: hypothetical protein VNS09_08645 [Solirubrobacter sp.]|nr:hypothetical protein [Solirubrobacter sp.]